MQHRTPYLPILLLALTLAPATLHAAPPVKKAQTSADKPSTAPAPPDNPYVKRFKELDRNQDGFVTPDEWPLEASKFTVVDRDKDGRLSPHELLTPNVMPDSRYDGLFNSLDLNRDGILTADEWAPLGAGIGTLDRDRDGKVSRNEYENTWNSRATLPEQRAFRGIDRNRDNRVSRFEWSGSEAQFNRLDRNRDGVLTPNEWQRR